MGLQTDLTQQVVNVQWTSPVVAALSLNFNVGQTSFYADGTPTIATLSTLNLPALNPNSFRVNLPEGFPVPPFFPAAYYGGSTDLSMPDGEHATLTADWQILQQPSGTVNGSVNYRTVKNEPGTWRPFLGANIIQIIMTINLRPLDFLGFASAGNHYEWTAFANFVPSTGSAFPETKSGKAGSLQTLRFTARGIMDPPSFTFTVS